VSVTINANVMARLEDEIDATQRDMDSADEGEKSFLLGKLTALLAARDGLGNVAAYEEALAMWNDVRASQP